MVEDEDTKDSEQWWRGKVVSGSDELKRQRSEREKRMSGIVNRGSI